MSLNDRLAALTPEQRALFEKLKEKQRQSASTVRSTQPPPIRRVSGPTGEGDWPLSLDQERYWFMEQLYPEGAGLNITAATRMRGTVSPATVAAALTEIVRRHAAWRTVFPAVDGKPVQRVTAARPQRLAVIDLGGLPAARREPEALRLVNEDSATVFDLEAGPLVRSSLVRLSDRGEARDHVCILTVHHMVTDWISFQVAWGELAALYETFAAGGRPALPEPPVHYSDFAVWQRDWLQGEVLDGLTAWWRERLAGFPVILDLPTDRPRPSSPRMRGGSLPVAVPAELTGGLRRLAQREGSTLFMVVLAATAALLHRDSGQERLVLGANNANRNRPEIETVLGCFLTQVPFAIDLEGDPTFRELLARVRQSALGAYSHQDLPFGLLVQAIELERDPSRQPLIQTLVQVLGGQQSSSEALLGGLGDATFEAISSYDGRARYDLLLSLFDNPGGLQGTLEYDLDLFDAATTKRRIERLVLQLAAVVADPDVRLSALPVLPEAARHQVEVEWNDTARMSGPGGSDWTAPRRFAEQAARTPEALAVDSAAGTLSYRQLDELSDALAYRLRALGISAESRVVLLLGRTLDVPVAIFGVWKAGGAYVPLDPDTPPVRLAALLDDAEPALVIHRGGLPAALGEGLRSLDLAIEEPALTTAPLNTELPEVRPEHLAYLIYTSGTTGKPKAVMVEHGNLAVTLTSFIDRFSLTPGDRIPHLSRYTFDASFLDIVAPLLCGGCMEILTRDELLDPDRLLQALARSATLFTVPSLARRILPGARESAPGRFAGLRAITLGGDVVPPELQAEILAVFPSTHLDVVYGPTETTIICVLHRVPRGRRPERALIGRPMPEVELRVMDSRGQAVPLGIPGELWIGGPTVARGYFRREELTAERFVVAEGRRFYRTGDLVRQVPSEGGALEFLGRIDLQVKVRGFRIEPGEVEAALLGNPAVRDAVVVAHAEPGGENQLVAYVVMAEETAGVAPPAEELRTFLRGLLPEHMVPSVFVPLAALPLSANGKVDRKALPAPAAAREALAGSAGWATPRNAREELLAEVWRDVLGLDQVGIHDNFFQLGGDSILSIQVVARARRAGLLISPRQLFENQTIAGLAAVSGVGSADAGSAEEAQGPVEGEVPLTPIQRRFFAEERREPWRFNQAVLLAPRERLAAAPLAAALGRLAGHHDALRLRFLHEEGGWRQLHAPIGSAAASAPLFEIDLTALPPGSGALETAAEQLQGELDLSRGPIFTAALFRRGEEGDEGEEGDRLLLTAHHLVVDGVSWRVLLEDLTALLRGLELAPKTTSWKRWAELLAGYAGGAELAAERGYWLGIGGKDQRDSKDQKDPKDSNKLATVSVELGAAATRALLLEAPPVYRTQVNDLLLAALARTFAAWSGEGGLLIDLEGHGREEIFSGVDLSRTVGWFTTIFPVALELPPGAGPREAIRSVKESLRAVPGRGLGYGLLRYLGDSETTERFAALPVPQVSFNYLGRFDAAVGEGGLFAFAAEAVRGAEGEPIPGDHLFAVDALVLDDRLRVNWTYDRARHLPATAERLAHGFLAELEALAAHCLSPEAGGFTPSDFPLARLDQEALDRLIGNDPGVEDLYPLAPMQEGLLFHSLYTPGGGLYIEQFTAALEGPLDAPAFAAAWQRVIERHPALRTGFLWQGIESPLQLVRRRAELPWTVEDWRGLPPSEVEARWQDLLAAGLARGFDLAQTPLMRLLLVRTGEDRHLLAWSSHHLLFDGWCFSLILSEVFALYASAVSGGGAPLPPPPRPYRDYIAWIAGRDPVEADRYWRQALSGFTAPTPVPFDHPEALSGAHAGRADDYFQRVLTLPAPRAAALGALAQRLQVTLNTLVQAVWALFLARSAQVSDIVFGAVVSGRPAELPGVESMIGLFINTVPVRVEVPREGTAAAWLARLQASQFELRQHEWTPLTRIQALSEVSPREPLFASLLVFENYPVAPSVSERLRELRITEVEHGELTNYPLTLIVAVQGELALRLTADRRFEPATAQRLLTQLDNLLGALAADPERPPMSLPLLSAAEQHQLTVEWNDTAADYPAASSIPALFAEQAALHPAAVAVEMGNERLTYGELRQRAGRFARRLLALGTRPGDRVAVLAERSPDLIAALLGILEAGGAYLPLDPVQPADRLAWMARDAGASLLVNAGGHAGPARELPEGLRLVVLEGGDEDDGSPEAVPELPPLPPIPSEALAYVLYTSGSTGTPKGVAVSHRSVLRLVRGADFAAMGPDEAWLQYSPIAFDLSTLEIWAPLLNGGRLVLFPGRIGSLEELSEIISRHGVTSAWLTAGLFHEMVDGCLDGLRPLRQLLAGGDVVSAEHVRRTLEALPGLTLIDGYGPTENTTFTSCHRMTSVEDVGASVPIGRPIANSRAYVLDDSLQPVPTGVWGELYAGGDGVASGYLERPDLTAERFLPDPFPVPGETGGRLYRTGDSVRWRDDGVLEFQGRLDAQIKIRGFRIEPGEVEAVLVACPGVQRAAVVGIGPVGNKRLAAFWVGDAKVEELRAFLRARLPEAMVPSAFVPLPDLPLTANGKVDRRALAVIGGTEVAAARPAERVPPRTPMEEDLVAAWAEVLKRDPGEISVLDNFFDLGGHSLLVTRFISLFRSQFGIEVPMQLVFDTENLAGLADRIVESELVEADDDMLAALLAEMGETPV